MTTAYITMLFVLLRYGMGRHVILVTDPRGFTIVSEKLITPTSVAYV